MRFLLRTLCKNEKDGATGIEYSLIAAGVSLAIIFVVFAFGGQLVNLFNIVEDALRDVNDRGG